MSDLGGKTLVKYVCLLCFVFTFVFLSNKISTYVLYEQKSDYREYYIEATSKDSLTIEEFNELTRRGEVFMSDKKHSDEIATLYFYMLTFLMSVYSILLFYSLRFYLKGYHFASVLLLTTISAFFACVSFYQGTIWFLISLAVCSLLLKNKILRF
ncbi:hypothetical protein HQQ94_01970 [Shewanella sp. VB17]|uniref:hypothetical protein n=1 Tax=Shewanella sp. VB17 TaxID=2739432 RepID=UPI0015634B18|nr:hypothetical protein [Shewanella sp. VB17]NRD72029.1 hypothetical protein [Shewanella sp. VB17]